VSIASPTEENDQICPMKGQKQDKSNLSDQSVSKHEAKGEANNEYKKSKSQINQGKDQRNSHWQ
jgi:hypothetical protein